VSHRRWLSIPTVFVDLVLGDAQSFPGPRGSLADAREVGSSALCVAKDLSREGDGLDRLTYFVGSGLSWKPIAAAFRFSVSSILAFILASYSSIDWTTYSWPYLSIL
jgi:hypothetical protein